MQAFALGTRTELADGAAWNPYPASGVDAQGSGSSRIMILKGLSSLMSEALFLGIITARLAIRAAFFTNPISK